MCVEVVKSMALKPTWSMTDAMLRLFAVSMPMAPHRHWLPSRSEVSTSCTSAMAACSVRHAALQVAREKSAIDTAGGELRVRQQRALEFEIGGHAFDTRRVERAAQSRQRR